MIEFLKGLEFVWLCWFAITFSLTFFCLRNYILYWVAFTANGTFQQNIFGRILNWFWLSSVIILTVKFV